MSIIPKVIGEGAYGCVHSPSLHCKNKPNMDYTDMVSKLMTHRHALSELNEYAGIEKADPGQKYYLGKPIICEPENTVEAEQAMKLCKEKFTEKSLLIMKDGGLNIKDLVTGWSKMPLTPELISDVTDFWLETHKLLIGLKLFLSSDIVHHDLKAENIVYNNKTKTIAFIDFGLMRPLSITMKNAMNNYENMAFEHWSYPWENVFITRENYQNMASKSDAIKRNHVAKIAKQLNDANTHYGVFIQHVLPKNNHILDNTKYSVDDADELKIKTQIEYFVGDYDDFLLKSKPEKYDQFLKKACETFDLFGLGFSLAFAWRQTVNILLHTQINVVLLNSTIFGMMRPDVYDRYDVNTAIGVYEMVLEPLAKSKGLSFQNHILKPKNVTHLDIAKPKRISDEKLDILTAKADEKLKAICSSGKVINPLTGRCVKQCREGQYRNKKFRCISRKSRKTTANKTLSTLP